MIPGISMSLAQGPRATRGLALLLRPALNPPRSLCANTNFLLAAVLHIAHLVLLPPVACFFVPAHARSIVLFPIAVATAIDTLGPEFPPAASLTASRRQLRN